VSDQPTIRDEERLDLPSASKMERVVNCPGSHNLEKSLPPEAFEQKEKQDEDPEGLAARGTRIHAAFETGKTDDLDSEENDIYQAGLKYEQEIVQKWMHDKALDECEEGPREMRVWLHDPLHYPELLGSVKLDRHYYNQARGLVLVTDLKSGWNPNLPPSPHSWQLRFGAVALWREEYGDWMKECRVAYCKAQQKCTASDFADYGEMDLKYSWDSIQFHLWQSTQPDAPLRVGSHCGFCPCKAYCLPSGGYAMLPTVAARRVPRAAEMSWDLMVEHMSHQDLFKVWEVSTITEKIIDAVKARLKAMPTAELTALGLELGEGAKLDPIEDVAGAFVFLCHEMPEDRVLKCMKIGKGELAALIRELKGKTKVQAQEWINSYLDRFITRAKSEAPLRRIKAV
jgi:hypothetical protein